MSAAPPAAPLSSSDDKPTYLPSNNGPSSSSSGSPRSSKKMSKEDDFDNFKVLWGQFYDRARALTTSASDEDDDDGGGGEEEEREGDPSSNRRKRQILKTLEALQGLLFGLDEDKKSIAVNYDKGGLELILSLAGRRSEEDVVLAGLKAIKCCVVRNPAGRMRCRRAGVFVYISEVLKECCKGQKETIADEVLTTFAAICLGDDLNALQGSMEQKEYIETISSIYSPPPSSPPSKPTNIQKMSTYLLTLFTTIQSELPPQSTSNPYPITNDKNFFPNLTKAQQLQSEADHALSNKQHGFAEGKYTNALNSILDEERFHLPAVKKLIGQLYSDRAICRFETGYHESALSDADRSLKFWPDGGENRVVRAKILKVLGREEEARSEVGKGLMADETLTMGDDLRVLMERGGNDNVDLKKG